jgi:hypothetical protein
MIEIFQRELNKVIRSLESMNLNYAIIDSDGAIHGTLQIAQPDTRKKRNKGLYEKGELKSYIYPFIQDMKEKEIIVIPYTKFERNIFQRAVCAMAHDLWGAGNYTSSMQEDGLQLHRFVVKTSFTKLI